MKGFELEAMGELCQFRRVLNACWEDGFVGTAKKMAENYGKYFLDPLTLFRLLL